jgi:hypothetical protein
MNNRRSPEGTEEAPGEEEAILRRAARYAWALLLPRIPEVFPLVCPRYGGERRIIAFIIDASAVRDILSHLGEPTVPPRLMRGRVRPRSGRCRAPTRARTIPRLNRGLSTLSTNSISALPGWCAMEVALRNGPDRSKTSCHRPSWDDSCLGPFARPDRPGEWPKALRGGIRMTFMGFPGPNAKLTLVDEGPYTLVGTVGFSILSSA